MQSAYREQTRCPCTIVFATLWLAKQAGYVHFLPCQADLVVKIAELVEARVIEGVSDVRDESDRTGTRMVVEVKRGFSAEVVLNQLFTNTRLQMRFSCNMVRRVLVELAVWLPAWFLYPSRFNGGEGGVSPTAPLPMLGLQNIALSSVDFPALALLAPMFQLVSGAGSAFTQRPATNYNVSFAARRLRWWTACPRRWACWTA